MGALIVVGLAVAALLVSVARLARRRDAGRAAATAGSDAPARLLGWAVGALPIDRAPWGEAMVGELHHIDERAQRWRFAVGCASAAVFLPSRRAGSASLTAKLVATTALACAGLVAYGLAQYPEIVTRARTWPVLAVFLSVLVGYAVVSAILVRRGPVIASGVTCGLGLAAVWIVAGIPEVTQGSQPVESLLLLSAIPVASVAVGAAAARRSSTAAVRQHVVLFSAVVAGLVVFLVYASDILLTAGGPYDAGQIRDFPRSGFPDLATYAVSDNLGSAMMLLLLIPIATATFGCTGASIAARLRHR